MVIAIFLAVSVSSTVLLLNISSFLTEWLESGWRDLHVSSTCSWVSSAASHLRHFKPGYLFLKLFFTSSILVRAWKIMLALVLLNLFRYCCLFIGFHSCFPSSRYLTLDSSWPALSILVLKYAAVLFFILYFT